MLIHLMFGLVCNVFAFAFQGQGKYTNKSTEAEVGLGGRSTEQHKRQQEAACADCLVRIVMFCCFNLVIYCCFDLKVKESIQRMAIRRATGKVNFSTRSRG